LLVSQGRATAPDTSIAADADLLKYEQQHGGRMTVPVTVNGSGPYDFLIDTGSERTIISRELAAELRLGAGPKTRMQSLTGASSVATVMIPKLELSRRTVRSIAAPALARAHIGASGMLGIDSLKAQHIVFDFVGRTMALNPTEPIAQKKWNDEEIVVTARTRLGRLVLADATVHGSKVVVILDTGAEVSMGNEALRRKLIQMRKLKTTAPIQLISITGARLAADYTVVGRVTIGGLRMTDMAVAFGDVELFDELGLGERPAILLGMDVLSRFDRVAVDFSKREVRFLLPKRVPPELAWARSARTN
jgi:predicted aspartyl protease